MENKKNRALDQNQYTIFAEYTRRSNRLKPLRIKRIAFHLFCCFATVLFVSCGGKIVAITGEVTHISCLNAEISGKANIKGGTSTDLTFGVLYSTHSDVLLGTASQIPAKSFDSGYNYMVYTEVLEPETTYYYRSYVLQNNIIIYGDTKTFTTLPVRSMIKTEGATNIETAAASLHATLDLIDCKYKTLEYGFLYAPHDGQLVKIVANNLSCKAFSATALSLMPSTQYETCAYVILDGRTYKADIKEFTTKRQLPSGAVDMGLSVLWHRCNIGASKPEEFGKYYAWGEITTSFNYSWFDYSFWGEEPYSIGGDPNAHITKYCTNEEFGEHGMIDNLRSLETIDDVASQRLGKKWRIPSIREWEELMAEENCIWIWKSELSTGDRLIDGYQVISRKTNNSIFLPAAGCYPSYPGDNGYYWSSSLDTVFPRRAWCAFFSSISLKQVCHGRADGMPVRPVCD